jgi:hypothetical protein
MAIGDVASVEWLTAGDITPALRRQSGDDAATVLTWTHDRLVGGAGEGIGVWRVVGNAIVHGTPQPWSMVFKGWSAPAGNADPTTFNWPHREMELYCCGLLADLPGGIRAPACFGDLQCEDGSVWVWLEDITDAETGLRSLDHYAAVARRLGQFNGAWTVDRPLPQHPALSQNWTHQWVEATGPYLSMFAQEDSNQFVQEVYPPDVVEAYMRLWENRHAAYAVLDRLPRAFCHMDAFSRNIFTRGNPVDPDDLILIDWSFAGIASIGEELAPLVGASAWFMDLPIDTIAGAQDIVLEAYIEGLCEGGWLGKPDEIRRGCRIAMVLRYGLGAIRISLNGLRGGWSHADIEEVVGHPFEEYTAHLAAVNHWLIGPMHKEGEIGV